MTSPSSVLPPPVLTLFVACYNEEGNIVAALDTAISACVEVGVTYEIIVIDDASQDRSVPLVEEYIRQHPEIRLRLAINKQNEGLGVNYVEGAFLGTGEWYRLVCGDNVESKETLVQILSKIGQADLIIPYTIGPAVRSLGRVMLSRFFTFLVNLISGYHIRYYNGCCLTRRQLVLRWHSISHGFGFQADLITRLLSRGYTYVEVPVRPMERATGVSKALTLRNILSVAHSLSNIAIRRIAKILYGRC